VELQQFSSSYDAACAQSSSYDAACAQSSSYDAACAQSSSYDADCAQSFFFMMQLVFSEAWWVGRKDENPEEKRLPLPPELSSHTPHQGYHFTYGAQACKKGDS
jgi:hypothetical protein